MWQLPGNTRLPRYKRLIALIQDLLEQGSLAGGDRLPAERDLALRLGLNRSTVSQALDELSDLGVLIRKRGSGTYVNPEKWGLQNQQVFNWQPPPAVEAQKRNNPYILQANALREQALEDARPLLDLSLDSLPDNLLPEINLPDISWRELLCAEQKTESALSGLPDFKRSVQRHCRENCGMEIPEQEILITSGTQQALFLISQGLLRPGDPVGIESPSYFYSLPVFQAAGLRLFALPMDAQGIRPECLAALHDLRGIRMIFLNPAFQNPTGLCMSMERKKKILQYCLKKQIIIFEDDAYGQLAFEPGHENLPLKALDRNNLVIYAASLSSYAGSGLRTGWMAAPRQIVHKLGGIRRHMDAGLSVLPQFLGMSYLDNYFFRHAGILRQELARRSASFARWLAGRFADALETDFPTGGLYSYLRIREGAFPEKESFLRRCSEERLIMAPAFEFGGPGNAFRCNFGHFTEELQQEGLSHNKLVIT